MTPDQLNQQACWNGRAKVWREWDVPLIPSQPEIEFQRQQIVPGGKTLILGVTPQICKMALETSGSVTAVDFAQDVIDLLHMDGVEYICQDWLSFFTETTEQYDTILTDGGLLTMRLPDEWEQLNQRIHDHLQPGGVFSARIYLSLDRQPEAHYDNTNIDRFVPEIAHIDENWSTWVSSRGFEILYAFPPKDVVIRIFSKFSLKDEFTPQYEEGDRFVSFAFQRSASS